ncbi:hypothetical protein F2P81_022505 [Scophthalmus maximus]|uniref:Neurotrypsin n=1 Tax=Scophthalmus maximus TaxID=52904 RepID=A0A6A4S526_SCOMX|nr:hypothetical protein F2P81_022505 [Scophthalmus maximus]
MRLALHVVIRSVIHVHRYTCDVSSPLFCGLIFSHCDVGSLSELHSHIPPARPLTEDYLEYLDTAVLNKGGVPLSCSEGFTELGYYNGTVSQTDSGAPCLKWTEFPDYVMQYPGRGLGDHSYCRNPDRESNPWCFFRQNSGAIGWAYCDCHQGAARLVGSSFSGSGRVEVYLNGQWGAVCDSHWTDRDASVVCRQLGLSDIGTALQHSQFGSGSGLFHYERLGCRGDENALSNCRSRTFVTGDCSHGNEAAVLCAPPEGSGPPLRLVGGEEDFEGRVEVFHAGRWGSVCDDQWDDRDAEVVCRQLGFGRSADGVVRLVGGDSPWEGRVEVLHNGDWGTVCDDHWTQQHAEVVCRQLGYRGHAEVVSDGTFGEGVGLILLDDVHCAGSETSLLDCPHGIWGRTDCSHGEDVGVRCRARSGLETNEVPVIAPSTGPLVRLVGGGSRKEGRVEVYLHGDWGSICDSGWNDLNAAVVCRQLGHSGGAVAARGFGQGKGPIHLDQVRCTGKEEFLGECPSLGQSFQSCRRREDAGARCDAAPTQESAAQAKPEERSCGLRKLVVGEGKGSKGRSQGEENTLRTTWPWQVSVWLQSQEKDGGPLCSGTLISPCWALTSAHCVSRFGSDPSRYVVRVGASERTLTPERVVVHRKYKGQSGGHDLALMKLPSAKGHCLTFDPNTNAACLSAADTESGGNAPSSCVVMVTAAWTGPDSVLASWVPLMSSWQCKKRYGDSFSSHGTLCAGSPPDTSLLHGNSCQGNSGGGLLCQGETGRWVLTGLVAGGYSCADPSSPALYTRVSRFRSWIDEVVGVREEPQAHTQTRGDLTHNDLTHAREERAHGEGKDEYFHTHGKVKPAHDQQQTNEIGEIKQKHAHAHHPHTDQHVDVHTKSTHAHHVGESDTNTQILV